ncbi:MAG: hypothetical protein RR280_01150 [Bacteroidaceae bacterium]
MSDSKILLKTAWGQTVELHSVDGNLASVWTTTVVGGTSYLRNKTFHVSKLFNMDGSPFQAEGN